MTNKCLCQILLIEDDRDDRELFENALSEVSPNTRLYSTASCSEAFIGLEAETIPVPEVIFLDYNMPEMDGIECAALIQKNYHLKDVPIVIMSGAELRTAPETLYAMGIYYFIVKPPSFLKLKAILDKLVNAPELFCEESKGPFFANQEDY